jgi:hypothetical protein
MIFVSKKNKIPKDRIVALEKALIYALKESYKEKIIMDSMSEIGKQGGNRYTEENLRYMVMSSISAIEHFGTYPNKDNSNHHLAFQFRYAHFINDNEKDDSDLIPDIVSLTCTKNRYYSLNSPLVIELKIVDQLKRKKSNPKDKLIERIEEVGAGIEADILKTRIYLTKVRDSNTFEIGVIVILSTNQNFDILNLQELLENQRQEIKDSKKSHKTILFAWFNPLIEKPELIWLNQPNEIKLGRVK